MRMKRFVFLFTIFISIIIFIGAGCSNKNNPENTPKDLPKENTEIKATDTDLALAQRAYIYCNGEGQRTSLRFDINSNKIKLFCIIDERYICEAVKFLYNECPTEDTPDSSKELVFAEEDCNLDVRPVCGDDGYTYVNKCIAKLQQTEVLYEGKCNGEDVKENEEAQKTLDDEKKDNTPESKPSANTGTSPKKNNTNVTPSKEPITTQDQSWIDVLIDLSEHESTKKFTTIEECTISGEKTYLKASECPTCFSVLYDTAGSVMCYPGNDLRDRCPVDLNINRRASSCRVIWDGSK